MKNKYVGDFNIDAYQENDTPGKDIFKKYLKNKGFAVLDKPEDLGIDLLAYKNGVEYRFEIELSHKNSLTEPDGTVSFLGRKQKMKNFYYVKIHLKTKQFVAPKSSAIFQANFLVLKDVNSKHRIGKDVFYHVPLQQLKVRKL